jgi:hypothetical protein
LLDLWGCTDVVAFTAVGLMSDIIQSIFCFKFKFMLMKKIRSAILL